MTSDTIITLGNLGCTGYIDFNGYLLHDGDCPVHETETIEGLAANLAEVPAGERLILLVQMRDAHALTIYEAKAIYEGSATTEGAPR